MAWLVPQLYWGSVTADGQPSAANSGLARWKPLDVLPTPCELIGFMMRRFSTWLVEPKVLQVSPAKGASLAEMSLWTPRNGTPGR